MNGNVLQRGFGLMMGVACALVLAAPNASAHAASGMTPLLMVQPMAQDSLQPASVIEVAQYDEEEVKEAETTETIETEESSDEEQYEEEEEGDEGYEEDE